MSMHSYSIRTKITFYFAIILITVILLVGVTSYFAGRKLLQDGAFNTLNSIRTIKTGQVEQYLSMLQDQCLSLSESTMTFDAMESLRDGFNALQAPETELTVYKQELEKFYTDEFLPKLNKTAQIPHTLNEYFPLDLQTIIIQAWYLAQNPQPVQKKFEYARATAVHPYNTAHEKYHSIFKRYAQRVVISDLYLIDLVTGHVIYSLAKEIDFGTNLITGPLKDTGLGRSFLELQKTNDENFVKIIDFQFYSPSYGTPVGFISTPIFKDGKKVGGLVFKFPIDTINQIMTYDKHWQDVGLGKTGESFLIGRDKFMRTIARQYLEDPTAYIKFLRKHEYDAATLDKIQVYDTTVLLKKIDLDIIRDLFNGKTSTVITNDTFEQKVIFSYSPVKIGDIDWYILVKINTQEALEPINTLLWHIILCGFIIILLGIFAAFIAVFVLTKPLAEIMQVFNNNTVSITQKIFTNKLAEFATIGEAYNQIIEYVEVLAQHVESIENEIREREHTVTELGTNTLKNNASILQLMHTLQDKNSTTSLVIKNNTELYQQDGVYSAQVITILKLMETTHTSIAKYIDDMCNTLGTIEDTLASNQTSEPALKNSVQQSVRICNSITPLLINADNSCKQIIQLFDNMHIKQEQKNSVVESLSLIARDEIDIINQIDHLVAANGTYIKEMQALEQKYKETADKLAALIKEIHV